jgi:hypothetical protein
VVALDDFLGDVPSLSLLKADVEGAEHFVFEGARRLIAHHHPTIVCEINPWFLDGFGVSEADLLNPLLGEGYDIFRLVGGKLEQVSSGGLEEDNYVLVHPDRREAERSLL